MVEGVVPPLLVQLTLVHLALTNQLLSVLLEIRSVEVAHLEDKGLHLACLVAAIVVDLLYQRALALDATVGNLADLLRVEGLP